MTMVHVELLVEMQPAKLVANDTMADPSSIAMNMWSNRYPNTSSSWSNPVRAGTLESVLWRRGTVVRQVIDAQALQGGTTSD
jgi:hypothetical protein